MLDIEKIEKAIIELEQHDTTFATCEKLSYLYVVKDHIIKQENTHNALVERSNVSNSEFLNACNGKDVNFILSILDEHLECIKLLYPKEYSKIIQKIKE